MKWWHWPSFGPVEMADNPQQTQKNLRQPKGKLHFSFSQLSFETLLTICIAASMQKIQYLHRNLFEYWLIIVYWNSVVFHSIWMTKLGTHRRTVAELSPTGNAASLNSHFFFSDWIHSSCGVTKSILRIFKPRGLMETRQCRHSICTDQLKWCWARHNFKIQIGL